LAQELRLQDSPVAASGPRFAIMFGCCAQDPNAAGAESITAERPVSTPVAASGSTQAPTQEPVAHRDDFAPRAPLADEDLKTILEDVDTAELIKYMEIFETFVPAEGKVSPEDEPMRNFLQRCTSVGEELDPVIFASGAIEAGGLNLDTFLQIIRQNSMSDSRLIEEFYKVAEQDVVPPEECRSALRSLCEQELSAQFSEDQWDGILTTVMREVGAEVPMEMWMALAKHCARITRLAQGPQ